MKIKDFLKAEGCTSFSKTIYYSKDNNIPGLLYLTEKGNNVLLFAKNIQIPANEQEFKELIRDGHVITNAKGYNRLAVNSLESIDALEDWLS